MKTLLHICVTLTTGAMVPLALAQNEVPGSRPGENKPGQPAQPSEGARPDSKEDAARGRTHDAAVNPANEAEFVKIAAKKGAAEVKVAQLAVEKAEDAKVKDLARMLVKDHTAANAQLKTVAEGLEIKPGETADEKAQEKYNELNGRTGKQFDQAFVEHMAMCHEKSIALFEAGRKVAKSEQVIALIDKTLPVLKAHAQKINGLHTGGDRPAASTEQPAAGADRPGSQPQPGTNRR